MLTYISQCFVICHVICDAYNGTLYWSMSYRDLTIVVALYAILFYNCPCYFEKWPRWQDHGQLPTDDLNLGLHGVCLTHWPLGDLNLILGRQFLMLTLVNDGWGISYEIALRWMPQDLTDDKSTLVQVMAWCRQATNHYLSQCWPRSLSPYGVTRPQWVKVPMRCHHILQHTWKRDDMKCLPHHWPFGRGTHRSPVDFYHKWP